MPEETPIGGVAAPAVAAEEQPQYSRRETIMTMIGVLLVMLLASLDQTIVSTAEPHIIADLQGFNHYTWVSTAYLLASTVVVPIYGKLSDLFGRKPIFLFGVVLFLTGSALCGAAQSMDELIAFRAFQGLGAAALMPIAFAVVGDLFTPRERGKWQGLVGAIWGLSAIIGPTLGGWITENSTWRWVFYVNLPIGIVALFVLIFLMPALKSSKSVVIDYVGAVLLVLCAVPLLLGFTWAGSQYAWLSPQILGLFAFALVMGVSFILYEMKQEREDKQPILDPSLFANRIFSVSALIMMIVGLALFGSVYFIPLFVQGIIGTTATNSGVVMTPMLVTSMISSILAGQLVARLGRYKWVAVVGMAISVCGSLLLDRLNVHSVNSDVIMAMIVLGFGMGFSMSIYTLAVQNALPPKKIGQGTSALVFFRSIGSTMGLAAMGSLMNSAYLPAFQHALPAAVKQAVPAQDLASFNNPQILLAAGAQEQIKQAFMNPPAGTTQPGFTQAQGLQIYNMVMEAVKQGLTQGLHNIFVFCSVMMAIGFIAVFFLKEIKLRERKKDVATEVAVNGIEELAQEGTSSVAFH
jgi:EmrB/QacA subfamily drug resistance transporter